MRLFTRMIVCAGAAIVLSAVLFHFADAWLGEDGSVLGAGRQIVLESRRSQALRARADMVLRSMEIKRDIVDHLIAGRVSFRQAIAQFQKANELVENVDLDLIPAYRSPTDPEGVARQVAIWVRNVIATWPPSKAHRLFAGLEREFQTLFRGSKLGVELQGWLMDANPAGRTETNPAVW